MFGVMFSRFSSVQAVSVISSMLVGSLTAPVALAQSASFEPTREHTASSEGTALIEVLRHAASLDQGERLSRPADEIELQAEALAEGETAMLELAEMLDVELSDTATASIASTSTESTSTESTSTEPTAPATPTAADLGSPEGVSISSMQPATVADPNWDRAAAAFGMQADVQADAVAALNEALASDNVLTQLYAADMLWNLTGDRDLILPTLTTAATSENAHARDLAVAALTQLSESGKLDGIPGSEMLAEVLNDESRTRRIAQDAVDVVQSENRTSTVLGIIARESRRLLIPPVIKAITGLW